MAAERRTYELSAEQEALLEAAILHPPLLVPGHEKESAQASADQAWQKIADELGFDWTTVAPLDPGSRRLFTAVPRI